MMKTVRQICTADYRSLGHKGEPPLEYIRAWRLANPDYGRWSLGTRFLSGSLVPVRSDSPLEDPDDRATEPAEVTARHEQVEAEMTAWRAEECARIKARGGNPYGLDPDYVPPA